MRFVTAASLFDGHDAAINIMRRILQSMGAEVIHLGHNRSVDEVVTAALQEDAQGIAVSSYQGGHVEYFKYMVDLLRQRGGEHIQVFGGGGAAVLYCRLSEITDGSSNTVALSESLKDCIDVWSTINDVSLGNMGGTFYSHFNTPNSTVADRPWGPCPVPQGDGSYKGPCTSLGGPNRPTGNSTNNQRQAHAAARSFHPGGVVVALADGSARFVSNNI